MNSISEQSFSASLWPTGPATPTLSDTDIHLWYLSTAQLGGDAHKLAPFLSADEQQRMKRYKFAQLRHDFLIRRGCLRLLLARYLSREPEQLVFKTGDYGKPYLENNSDPPVNFNLSHSTGAVLYGFARQSLGVDVEEVRPVDDMHLLAARFFSPDESDMLGATLPGQQIEVFFKVWTLKEAFIKATGQGLAYKLDRFSVGIDPARLITANNDPQAACQWRLTQLSPASGLIGAVAIRGGNRQQHCWQLTRQDLPGQYEE
jgi:4'-phosphopantetheinyl transferase